MKRSKLAVRALIGLLVASLSFPSVLPAYAAPVEVVVDQNSDDGAEEKLSTLAVSKKTVFLSFQLNGTQVNATTRFRVDADATSISLEDIKQYIPDGYEVVGDSFEIPTTGSTVVIEVEEKTHSLLVYYMVNGAEIAHERISVALSETTLLASDLRIPEGYKLVNDTIIFEAGSTSIEVEVEEKTHSLLVYYMANGAEIARERISVVLSETTLLASDLRIPEGYKLVNDTIIFEAGSTSIEVEVEEKTHSLLVYYMANGAEIARERVTVTSKQTTLLASDLKHIPNGYKLTNDTIIFETGTTSIRLEVEEKTVVILVNYKNEAGELLGSEKIEMAYSATVLLASDLTSVPEGYKLVNDTIVYVAGSESVDVLVEAIEVPVEKADAILTVNYVTSTGKVVGTQTIVKNGNVDELVRFTKEDLTLPNKYKVLGAFEDVIITFGTTDEVNVAVVKISTGGSGTGSSSSTGSKSDSTIFDVTASMSGEWVLDSTGWWFRYTNGTWPAGKWVQLYWNGKLDWYYFKPDGYMATGWVKDNDRWYYLHPYADGTQGYMYTGWKQINNKWYYFNPLAGGPKGAMMTDVATPDGFYVNSEGVWE